MTLIDGKEISSEVKARVAADVDALNSRGIQVRLAVVLVGDDPASKVYVRSKTKACEECGIISYQYTLPESTTEQELLDLIAELNGDSKINGILVQLPLPSHISEQAITSAIDSQKDVDAFHPYNVGKIMTGNPTFLPCTPAGCLELIKSTGTDITGKHCVVIGRSNIVGKPMAMLLLHRHGTVTICHSRTENLASITRQADILIAAVGKPNFVTGDMVKEDAVVIDVGINRLPSGKLCGDVDFQSVSPKAAFITPVPGGVGPMTIAMLMQNTVTAARLQNQEV